MENNRIRKIIKCLQEEDAKDYHDGIINGLSEDSVRAFLSMLEKEDTVVAKSELKGCGKMFLEDKYKEPVEEYEIKNRCSKDNLCPKCKESAESELDLCLKCGFVRKDHTEDIRKRNRKEKEPYPCKEFKK